MFRKKTVVVAALSVLALFFFVLYYLLAFLPSTLLEDEVRKSSLKIEKAIYEELKRLPVVPQKQGELKFLSNIQSTADLNVDLKELWDEANAWPTVAQITNISSPTLPKLLYALKRAKIIKADVDTRGTQLKLLLTLSGGQQVVFKPKWYDKDHVIEGPVYAGKDRYGAEIVAFYLSILMQKPLVPASVERALSLRYDILPVATERLVNTSFELGNNNTCIYGKCHYCKKGDPICDGIGGLLIGAVIFNVKKTFSNYRSPWQRTYKKNKKALWESDMNYCDKNIKNKLLKKRLDDLIDTSIFDFLMQNGDRHHYETFEDTVVWVDNGKGLGNPFVQHLDILAPLYQCCIVRAKTRQHLLDLGGGNLSKFMKLMPDIDNILTEHHLRAMEQRLVLVFATFEYCKKRKR